jgi:formylglycine-generating enzyme required for sulfatase activity
VVWCNALTEYYNANSGTDLVPAYNIMAAALPARSAAILNTNSDDVEQVSGATGFRMPKSVEWEYAARYIGATNLGGYGISMSGLYWTPGNYASGAAGTDAASIDAVAWYGGNTGAKQKVATKAPNVLGLYDMCGNVRDRCFDIFGTTYTADRGGAYNSTIAITHLQIGVVQGNDKDFCTGLYGFRLAQSK